MIGGKLVGWVLDEQRPQERLEVNATLDGVALGTTTADRSRSDLTSAGIGEGTHGFQFPVDPEALRPGSHVVVVEVAGLPGSLPLVSDWVAVGEGDAPLPDVVLRVPDTAAAAEQPAPAAAPTLALVGHGRWLFEVPPDGLDGLRGAVRGFDARMDAEAAAAEAFAALAASLDAVACLAVVPAKLHVYREHLPSGLTVDLEQRWGRRLARRLRDSDRAAVLDLLDPLSDARAHGRVFSRSGRSLTWLGAFHAYRAIAKTLGPALVPRPAGDASLGPPEPVADSLSGGTLATWLDGEAVPIDGLGRPLPADAEPTLDLPELRRGPRRRRPAGLVVHDGGGERIAALLGEHCSRSTVLVAEDVDIEAARAAKPDAIVWLRRDR